MMTVPDRNQETLMKTPFLTQPIRSSGLAGLLRFVLQSFACALVGAVLLTANTTAQPALEAPFTKITNGVLVTEIKNTTTAAWGDFDNDGWIDLFVGNWYQGGERNSLYRNNWDGTFTAVTSGPIATDAAAYTLGASWGDYDNDGWLDLVVGNFASSTPNFLYRNTGNGTFVRMTSTTVGTVAADASATRSVSWADYDGDGYLDLFAANGSLDFSAKDFLYHNSRDGRFTRVTSSAVEAQFLQSWQGLWADYDNDGDMDLFVTHGEFQGNALFRNDGSGQFTNVVAACGLGDLGECTGAAWGDYDNDGDLDLIVASHGGMGGTPVNPGPPQRNLLYRNKGNGTFERITTGIVVEDGDYYDSCAWVDYDNDGWLDLFVTVGGFGFAQQPLIKNRLYRNLSDGTFAKVTQGSLVTDGVNPVGCAWGDYNNDGFPDVFVAFGGVFGAQRNGLYRNNGNTNNWIKLKCVGTISNRSAIGAKVRVLADIDGTNRWQMRQIVGSEGLGSFNSLDVMIGLGDATNISTLRIEWPSGIVQEFHDVAAKQTLTMVEQTTLAIERRGEGDLDVILSGPRQQRYRLEASTNLTHWTTATSLTITNADRTASFKHTPSVNEPWRFFRATAE